MSAPDPTSQSVRVRIQDLHKSYGGVQALKGVSFEVERGETFVIMGPSGSGKSVLLKHIIGLEPADQGDIFVEDISVRDGEAMGRYRMALVFQSGALLNSLNVLDNVGLYLSEHRLKPQDEIDRIAIEKLDFLGLKNVKDRFPGELSGGMKKRVAIARALVMEPQLILYDEPTSELDPLSAVVIGEEIQNLQKRIHVTSIVVTHDRDLAFGIADRIAMMYEGELIAVGTVDEIRRHQHPIIHRFLNAKRESS
jgi:phospholipid/cholesterol/gamma-HCH transport system ATP-binding protein